MVNEADLLLLGRCRRVLIEEAAVVLRLHGPWTTAPASRAQKRRYDRLLREARDLADLRVRLAQMMVSQRGWLTMRPVTDLPA